MLSYLRRAHGKGESELESPRKVTLKRKSHSELKVSGGAAGRAKTVNVEVRKRRTYVKRSAIEQEQDADPEREAARKALEESRQRQEAEEQARVEAEEQRKQQEEQARQEAEEKARQEAEEKARLEAEEKARAEAEEAARKEAAARIEAQKQARAAEEARRAKKRASQQPKRPAGGGDTRYGRKQLHVAHPSKGGRRQPQKRRPQIKVSDQHGFSKPTAPVTREVLIPETITVAELGPAHGHQGR